jgi:hypothetical protein
MGLLFYVLKPCQCGSCPLFTDRPQFDAIKRGGRIRIGCSLAAALSLANQVGVLPQFITFRKFVDAGRIVQIAPLRCPFPNDLITGRRNNCTDDFGDHRQRYGGIQPPPPLRAAIGTSARVGGTEELKRITSTGIKSMDRTVLKS